MRIQAADLEAFLASLGEEARLGTDDDPVNFPRAVSTLDGEVYILRTIASELTIDISLVPVTGGRRLPLQGLHERQADFWQLELLGHA